MPVYFRGTKQGGTGFGSERCVKGHKGAPGIKGRAESKYGGIKRRVAEVLTRKEASEGWARPWARRDIKAQGTDKSQPRTKKSYEAEHQGPTANIF